MLLLALLLVWGVVFVVCVASFRSHVIAVGQATPRDLGRAIDEAEADISKTKEDIRRLIARLCKNYPELRETEDCIESEKGSHDEAR